ncbi:hypothetical protein, partial [Streptomyces decoyicus]|uniref:hypothetical protein n=1 Tax=Streptomyces decoyicus TaxID=249567 RepID=UPI003641EA0F
KITYLDAQTGQRSNTPLHDGTNGVHAIPLDPHRHPLPTNPTNPAHNNQNTESNRRPAADTRRPPSEPAGAPPERFDPEAVRGSAEFGERQGADHTQYDLPLEDSQGTLRVTHDVSQIDLAPVLDNAHRWASDGSLARVVAEAQANGRISQQRLNGLLKGFEGLNDEQKMAVVAGIARISTGYHAAQAAGSSPVNEDPGRRRPAGITEDLNPRPGVSMHENHEIKRLKEGESKPEPASLAREYAVAHEAGSPDQAAIDATHDKLDNLLKQNKDNGMRPDMSGKNYAVIEVHKTGKDGKIEVDYVIDSSIPGSKRYHHDHSEPHLGEWMRAVEAKHPGEYKVVSLFTEFEPCGDRSGTGGANCSDYLSNDMERGPEESRSRKKPERTMRDAKREGPIPKSNLRISYGIGYRKGAMGFEETAEQGEYATAAERREAIKEGKALDNAERDRVKKMTDSDMIKYRGEWLRIWMSAVTPTQPPQNPGTTSATV